MSSSLAAFLFVASPIPVIAQDSAANLSAQSLSDMELLERMHAGGLVILFRHGATGPDPDRPDAVSGRQVYPGSPHERQAAYLDCDRQRVLSEKGREDLRQIAIAIRKIGLPVSDAFASPLCRTRETAWLLAGQVRSSDALIGPLSEERNRLVTTVPGDGGNRILVSHSYVISSIISTPERPVDGEFVPRGSCLVLAPDADGQFRILAKLGPDDWTRLAQLAQ